MDMQHETRRTLRVWAALMVLLALTLGSAYLRLGVWNSVANMLIAVAKASLVAIFFMHLRDGPALVRVIAGIALFTLAILFAVSSADYATRVIYRAPLQTPAAVER